MKEFAAQRRMAGRDPGCTCPQGRRHCSDAERVGKEDAEDLGVRQAGAKPVEPASGEVFLRRTMIESQPAECRRNEHAPLEQSIDVLWSPVGEHAMRIDPARLFASIGREAQVERVR
jgi:hypothetical protein